MNPKISVCIPSFNRKEVLAPLLESVLLQDYTDCEIVVCEDKSPERSEIRQIVNGFIARNPGRIKYFENETNLGYDANLRNIIEKASGKYCFFMGNDDLMCKGALSTVASALKRHDNIGVVLRTYASFDGTPENINQVFRYFEKETLFPAGPRAIAAFYRRSVVIPGMVLHRAEALKYSTDKFDGILLYQLYLVANILVTMNGVSLPEITVLYRNGGIPYFGTSEKERGKFVPTVRTPESSVHFMRGMIEIAKYVEKSRNVPIAGAILKDIGNYSYPILSLQAGQPFFVFVKYCWQLAKLGMGRSLLFYIYFILILLVRPKGLDAMIRFVKKRLGHTPRLGKIF